MQGHDRSCRMTGKGSSVQELGYSGTSMLGWAVDGRVSWAVGGLSSRWDDGWVGVRVGGTVSVRAGGTVGVRVGRSAGGEGGRGPCHLAARTLEPHGAGLSVLRGRHRHGHVRELLLEFLEGGAGRTYHVTPLPWYRCQMSLDHSPFGQQGLEATCPGDPRTLTVSVTASSGGGTFTRTPTNSCCTASVWRRVAPRCSDAYEATQAAWCPRYLASKSLEHCPARPSGYAVCSCEEQCGLLYFSGQEA